MPMFNQSPVSGAGFFPVATVTEGAVRAAAAAARDAGGGYVLLPPARIPTTSALPTYPGVEYHGFGNEAYFWQTGPKLTGTVIDCQGLGHNGFEWNPDDQSTVITDMAALHATECTGAGFFGVTVINAAYGWKLGANLIGGVTRLKMGDVTAYNCSKWGFWLENCHRPSISRVQAHACSVGHFMLMSSATGFNYGNGELLHVHTIAGVDGWKARMIVLAARNSSDLNGMTTGGLTAVGCGVLYSETVSGTGTTDLAVSNLAHFALALPVYFTSSAGPVTAGRTYFVNYVSEETGAGVIRVCEYPGGPSLTLPAASLGTIHVRGGAGIELSAESTNSRITGLSVANTDTENCGIINVLMNKLRSSDISLGYMDPATPQQRQVALRDCDSTLTVTSRNVLSRIDTDVMTPIINGARIESYVNSTPLGLRGDQDSAVATMALYLGRQGRSIYIKGNGTLNAVSSDRVWADTPTYAASGATIDNNYTSLVVYTGTAGGNVTLPTIASAYTGIRYKIVNPTSGVITVNTSSSQTVNNAAGVTTYSIPANSSATFSASQTASGSGVFFWAT